jgi:hypothetical protein
MSFLQLRARVSGWLGSRWWGFAIVAIALLWGGMSADAVTPLKIEGVNYKDCPAEIAAGAVTSGGNTLPAKCFLIVGTIENKTLKPVYDADVYGRIFDADNNNILKNRGRLGSLTMVPPGKSEFELRISFPSNLPTPLRLERFKASGYSARIRANGIIENDEVELE